MANATDRFAELDQDDDRPRHLVAGYLWLYALVVIALPLAALAAAPLIAALVLS